MKKYPLEQLALIKKKKLDEAERVLREKKDKLIDEQDKLKKVEKERNTVKTHKIDKLEQFRNSMDAGERTDKIEQMRLYLKVVDENLKTHEKKVDVQKQHVVKAENEVEAARKEMVKRQKDVEKLKEHHVLWKKEALYEEEQQEAKDSDEIGEAGFIIRKQKKKRE